MVAWHRTVVGLQQPHGRWLSSVILRSVFRRQSRSCRHCRRTPHQYRIEVVLVLVVVVVVVGPGCWYWYRCWCWCWRWYWWCCCYSCRCYRCPWCCCWWCLVLVFPYSILTPGILQHSSMFLNESDGPADLLKLLKDLDEEEQAELLMSCSSSCNAFFAVCRCTGDAR